MAYHEKEKSPSVVKAEKRATGMKAVDLKRKATLNYGTAENPLTVDELNAQIAVVEAKRKQGNDTLKLADQINNEYGAEEDKLNKMVSQVLSSAVSLVGDDSDEYELLGGTRASERKRPVRKPKAVN